MEVIIQKNSTSANLLAAQHVAKRIRDKANIVLGLPTGGTPLQLYKELIRMHKEDGLDFTQVKTFNLDEYLGLSPDHPASYA